ncbi:UNVERIFIED_CONTAM: hypothetical protein FKN15_011398 [Acipenser sinensis]
MFNYKYHVITPGMGIRLLFPSSVTQSRFYYQLDQPPVCLANKLRVCLIIKLPVKPGMDHTAVQRESDSQPIKVPPWVGQLSPVDDRYVMRVCYLFMHSWVCMIFVHLALNLEACWIQWSKKGARYQEVEIPA